MPTDEERREVARKLREEGKAWDSSNQNPEWYYNHIDRCLGHPGLTFEGLADLIDPTCHAIDMGWPNDYAVVRKCDVCGRSWTEDPLIEPYNFCPNCGARVVTDDAD